MPDFKYSFVARRDEFEYATVGVLIASASEVLFVGHDQGVNPGGATTDWRETIRVAIANGSKPLELVEYFAGRGDGQFEWISKSRKISGIDADSVARKLLSRSKTAVK